MVERAQLRGPPPREAQRTLGSCVFVGGGCGEEAAQRWKRETSTYRDDITAIVARLPAMETGGERRRGWARVRFQLFKRQEDAQMLDVALCHRRGFKKVPPHRRPRPRSAR